MTGDDAETGDDAGAGAESEAGDDAGEGAESEAGAESKTGDDANASDSATRAAIIIKVSIFFIMLPFEVKNAASG